MARILIVEDEPLIAMIVQEWLLELGHEPVGPASTVDQAISLVNSVAFDAAIVDIHLQQSQCDPVAEALVAQAVPSAISTGGSPEAATQRFEGSPILSKPFIFDEFKAVIDRLSPSPPQ